MAGVGASGVLGPRLGLESRDLEGSLGLVKGAGSHLDADTTEPRLGGVSLDSVCRCKHRHSVELSWRWLTLHMPRKVSLGPRTEMQTAVPTREKGDFVAVHPVRVVRPPRTIIYKKISPETYFPGPHPPPPRGSLLNAIRTCRTLVQMPSRTSSHHQRQRCPRGLADPSLPLADSLRFDQAVRKSQANKSCCPGGGKPDGSYGAKSPTAARERCACSSSAIPGKPQL